MDYRELLVQSGLRMAASGLTVETWGNISARDPETGLVYLTPSAMKYDTITVDDVVVCDLDGNIVQELRCHISASPLVDTLRFLELIRHDSGRTDILKILC